MKPSAKAGALVVALVCFFLADIDTSADTIYASNYDAHYIETFDSNGNGTILADSSTGLRKPSGIAFDKEGHLFVANINNRTIQKREPNGSWSTFADATSGLYSPQGLAFDCSGNLYVANYDANNILRFDPSGNVSVFASTFEPMNLAFDSNGNLYVTNDGSGTYGVVKKFDPSGNGSIFADHASGLNTPFDLAFDSVGNLYVSDFSSNTIMKFDPNGNGAIFADSSSGLSKPGALAFDGTGNLYVCNFGGMSNNTILAFDLSGHGSVFATVPLGAAISIAVQVGDGIAYLWRRQYFGGNGVTTNSQSCALCDANGTGQNNLFKYVAGLDPTNPASVFVLQPVSVEAQPDVLNLNFAPVITGRTYTVQFSTDIVSGVYTTLTTVSGPLTNGTQITVTDLGAIQPNKFYRVRISLP